MYSFPRFYTIQNHIVCHIFSERLLWTFCCWSASAFWAWDPCYSNTVNASFFFFFFVFSRFKSDQLLCSRIYWLFYCEQCICALFMDPQIPLFTIFLLKMGPTVLFTHLKNISLQCFQFQFSISAKISSIQTDPKYRPACDTKLMSIVNNREPPVSHKNQEVLAIMP